MALVDTSLRRNIGISAHIDSGKTTLTERILYYTKRIHAIHEVKGKDGVGAKMDSMDLERERGITIQSAATHCTWKDLHVNIIDTPGHVDFTVEVERALRVLDGAILVLCGVAGVQSQSLTVDRQMRRYGVPRICFVNKLDRAGANPYRVADQVREKLGLNAVLLQIPIGLEDQHVGVVDLIRMRAFYFEGPQGDTIIEQEIPADLQAKAEEYREILLDRVSMHSDELTEAMLEGADHVTEEILRRAIRKATIGLHLAPVMMGSAYKNKGVQLLLDGVGDYLPNPSEVPNRAIPMDREGNELESVLLPCDADKPLVMLAFKLEDGRYGQLTYLRLYQGTARCNEFITNMRNGKKYKVGRLVRMHSDEMEDIEEAGCGDICAMFGIDCYSGDTFTDGRIDIVMTSMHVALPVISVSVTPADSKAQVNMSKALQRFSKEDPTFRVGVDQESGETIISGMGELHLDIYIERMKREYNAEVKVSPPQVAYREKITRKTEYAYTHRKQTGGSGQYGRVLGYFEPHDGTALDFEDDTTGGVVPKEYVPSVEKGFKSMMEKGPLTGFPIVGFKVVLNDGGYHAVDSSDIAFQEAARGAFREFYMSAKPVILEPIMKVEVETPTDFTGGVVGTLMTRRGAILGSNEEDGFARIEADVPLAEMFGYATIVRSATQGKAGFTMEFARYSPVPQVIGEQIIANYQKAKAAKK